MDPSAAFRNNTSQNTEFDKEAESTANHYRFVPEGRADSEIQLSFVGA